MEFFTLIFKAMINGGFYTSLALLYLGTWALARGKGKIWSLLMHDLVLIFIIYMVLFENGFFNN